MSFRRISMLVLAVIGLFAGLLSSSVAASADPPPPPGYVSGPPPGTPVEQPSFAVPIGSNGEGDVSTNGFGVGACGGSFFNPLQNGSGLFDWGTYIQCTSEVATQMSVVVYSCTWAGPNGYDCDSIAGARNGPLRVDYFNRTDVDVNCVSGVGGYFQPNMYSWEVNYVIQPQVMGNVEYVGADICT